MTLIAGLKSLIKYSKTMVRQHRSFIFPCLLVGLVFLFAIKVVQGVENEVAASEDWMDFWLTRLLLNVLGYASVVIPAWIIIRYIRKSGYLERPAGHGCVYTVVKSCVSGGDRVEPSLEEGGAKPQPVEKTPFQRGIILMFCVIGLQASYLTWGILQERIMAHEYGKDSTHSGEKFKNSQFLVFMNRILAFIAAFTIMSISKQPPHTAPLYRYSYCSLSNIMSSWCQYEALKFVTFPTQVMAKASKVIPVMLMSKLVSGKSHEFYEYVTAAMISVGVSMFLLAQGGEHKGSTVTTVSGVMILVGYMMFDSFTSNWQAELYSQYSMSSIQMMFGVNLFSCIFTSWSLIEQGGFSEGFEFMSKYNLFLFHVTLLSICSATGQLFIFYTISQFGAVIFTIIMTTRQALAILLSCVIYGHPITAVGALGVVIVFTALFLKVYARTKKSKAKQPNSSGGNSKV